MTDRRAFLVQAFAAVLLAPGDAWGETPAGQIARQLRDQGYTGITATRTWLGRVRITATSGAGMREIIVNPRTGEILRDVVLRQVEGGAVARIVGDESEGTRDDREDRAEEAEDDREDREDDAADDREDREDDAADDREDDDDSGDDSGGGGDGDDD